MMITMNQQFCIRWMEGQTIEIDMIIVTLDQSVMNVERSIFEKMPWQWHTVYIIHTCRSHANNNNNSSQQSHQFNFNHLWSCSFSWCVAFGVCIRL